MNIDKLRAMMEIIAEIQKERGWDHLYVSGNSYGYKKDGKWFEVDHEGNKTEV